MLDQSTHVFLTIKTWHFLSIRTWFRTFGPQSLAIMIRHCYPFSTIVSEPTADPHDAGFTSEFPGWLPPLRENVLVGGPHKPPTTA